MNVRCWPVHQAVMACLFAEDECAKCIKTVFERTGYLLDPHTAVAKHVADAMCANGAAESRPYL